jgi:3-dehydroquinate synthase
MNEIISNDHYSIFIDQSLQTLVQFLESRQDAFSRYFILVDEHTHTACIPLLLSKVKILQEAEIIEVDAGEEHKNLQTATGIWETLLENNADRQTLLINLGGGMVSDLGGFAASVFKRGIPFINIPTSFLAQIDAAIGSKTALDLNNAKNQLGSFAHPLAVFISVDFLNSLAEQDLHAGFGELLKYALIDSLELWEVVSNQEFSRDMDLEWMVFECVQIKNKIVQRDWLELGERKVLNFGHTIGHALESLSIIKGRRKLLHGEAIALGILVELYLSVKLLEFDSTLQKQIEAFILENFYLYSITNKDFSMLIDWMKKDKKNSQNGISFVLLRRIGEPVFNITIAEDQILEALAYYAEL